MLLLVWLSLVMHELFNGPYQPNIEQPESDITFIATKDLHALKPSKRCDEHKSSLRSLVNSPQSCEVDDDCSPFSLLGQSVTINTRTQYLQLSKTTIELCPLDVLTQATVNFDDSFNHISSTTVQCRNQFCQATPTLLIQNLVNDTLLHIKKP